MTVLIPKLVLVGTQLIPTISWEMKIVKAFMLKQDLDRGNPTEGKDFLKLLYAFPKPFDVMLIDSIYFYLR